MPNDELFDIAELCNGEVGSQRCLHAFFTDNSKSNVGLLDHSDVVSTITNARNHLSSEILDVDGNEGFLSWAATAHTNGLSCLRHSEELFTKTFVSDDKPKSGPIDHQHMRVCKVLVLFNFTHDSVWISLIRNDLDVLVAHFESSGDGDALSCLDLVSREHPNLKACLSQRLDSLQHVLLKFVFNTGDSQELHLVLKALDCFGDLSLTVDHA